MMTLDQLMASDVSALAGAVEGAGGEWTEAERDGVHTVSVSMNGRTVTSKAGELTLAWQGAAIAFFATLDGPCGPE
jgi:hypothetical protein